MRWPGGERLKCIIISMVCTLVVLSLSGININAMAAGSHKSSLSQKKQINLLKRRVRELENRLARYESPGFTTSVPVDEYLAPPEAWQTLRRGMPEGEVVRLIGRPTRTTTGIGWNAHNYFYPHGGVVRFDGKGNLISWKMPHFDQRSPQTKQRRHANRPLHLSGQRQQSSRRGSPRSEVRPVQTMPPPYSTYPYQPPPRPGTLPVRGWDAPPVPQVPQSAPPGWDAPPRPALQQGQAAPPAGGYNYGYPGYYGAYAAPPQAGMRPNQGWGSRRPAPAYFGQPSYWGAPPQAYRAPASAWGERTTGNSGGSSGSNKQSNVRPNYWDEP